MSLKNEYSSKIGSKIFRRNVELTYDHHKSYSFYYEENPVVTLLIRCTFRCFAEMFL